MFGVMGEYDRPPPDDPATKHAPQTESAIELELEAIAHRRDRLLASLVLMAGFALVLALPFALRAGAEFFLPVTTALVIAIALVPLLEWLERRRVPSALAALLCIILFLIVANIAVAAIVIPAADWFQRLPERIGQLRDTLAPLVDVYSNVEQFIDNVVRQFGRAPLPGPQAVRIETPSSLLQIIATSAPFAVIQSRPTAGAISRSLTLSPIATASAGVRPRRSRSQAIAAPLEMPRGIRW